MESINQHHSADLHCRYRMPVLEVKQDDRSKQRKTWLLNLRDVADKIHRDPDLLIAWYSEWHPGGGCDKKGGTERWFVKGHVETASLQTHTRDFCSKLVVCPTCGGADTRLFSVNKGGTKKKPDLGIRITCAACGEEHEVRCKQEAKLAKLIPEKRHGHRAIAPLPDTEPDVTDTSELEEKLAEYEKKLAKALKAHDDDKVKRYKSKVKKYKKELALLNAGGIDDDDDDEEWFTSYSEADVAARRSEALGNTSAFQKSLYQSDEDKELASKAEEKDEEFVTL